MYSSYSFSSKPQQHISATSQYCLCPLIHSKVPSSHSQRSVYLHMYIYIKGYFSFTTQMCQSPNESENL